MMRICYIGDGQSIHTQRWITFFAKKGHEVYLLTTSPGDISGVEEINYTIQKCFPKTGLIQHALKVKRLIEKIKPDILHAHFVYFHGWYGALSGFHPFVLTVWGSDIFIIPHQGIKNKYLTRYALRKADIVTGDSQDLLKAAIRLGAKEDKSYLIQFGVNTNLFQPGADTSKWREKLGISDEKVIFSPRAFNPIYNIDTIIKAFHKVQEKSEKVVLVLKRYLQPTDTPYEIKLKRLICDLGIEEKVKFVGKIPYDEMPGLYNIADVAVSIASSDGTPMSVLEAMACGVLLVVSDLPSLKEWIKDGWNGFVVPPNDEEAVCSAILRCLQISPPTRNEFSERNRSLILEKADYIKNMNQVEVLYSTLLS